jgi:hypothetical protein
MKNWDSVGKTIPHLVRLCRVQRGEEMQGKNDRRGNLASRTRGIYGGSIQSLNV